LITLVENELYKRGNNNNNNMEAKLGQVWRKVGNKYDFRVDTEYDLIMIENYPHKYEFLFENREIQKIESEIWLTKVKNYLSKQRAL
jgi:hypothetical protein